MTSAHIKHALMYYFRFDRQWLCASECMDNDVMVFTGKYILEVEVKISKSDLWHGEAKKDKHKWYRRDASVSAYFHKTYTPNKFYVCVPVAMESEAIRWVDQVNPRYGVITCRERDKIPYAVDIVRYAEKLTEEVNDRIRAKVLKRVCAENITMRGKALAQ